MLIKPCILHGVPRPRAYARFSLDSRARRQLVDGRRCANACTVNLGSRSFLKFQQESIKTDGHWGLLKLYIPKTNLQGTSQYVCTASGTTYVILFNVMINASAWLMQLVANNRAG
jgi:hypothetical protein